MLKKLKIKFVLTNMVLITLVFAAVFIAIYAYTRNTLYTESVAAMKEVASKDAIGDIHQNPPSNPKLEAPIFANGRYAHMSLFYVTLDSSKQIMTAVGYSYTLDSERLSELQKDVDTVLAERRELGTVPDKDMRYLISSTPHGIKIVFLDKTYETETLRTLIKTFAFVGGVSCLILFVLSWIIAKLSVAPIERSWNSQKRFVADASHELRTPLTIISSNAEYLLSLHSGEGENDGERKWIEFIKLEAERMNKLVSELLYLAKTDEEQSETVRKCFSAVSASDVVTECLLSFEPMCFEKSKTLKQSVEDGCCLLADADSLKQLFVIFLDNAFKHSGENGIIEVKLFKQQDKVVFSVANSGDKISDNDIPHLFERFYRTDSSRTRAKGGYGLGLAIAKSIVDSMGGKISVTSDEELTEFQCKFPSIKSKGEYRKK